MKQTKQERVLEIFFRGLRGEALSVQKLADEYEVSSKSITRALNDLKAFLADHRSLVGQTRLEYSHRDRCYRLIMDEFLSSSETFALVEVMIGARAFSRQELLLLAEKLQRFTVPEDRRKLHGLIGRELLQYPEVAHDCESVQELLWRLADCISERKEITIDYYRMDRKWVQHRLRPASVLFSDFYFYLIAFKTDGSTEKPLYFRVDRIRDLTVHRKHFADGETPGFDEGLLRRRSLLMFPGKLRTIRFEFSGPSVQAVLDKLPTAKILDHKDRTYLLEAEVYGDGIKMWLLSQGAWVKVLAPQEFAEEMKAQLEKMLARYTEE